MEIRKLIQTMELVEALKNNAHHPWIPKGWHESVTEYSWRLCFSVYLIRDEFPEADMDEILHMRLLHDMGEAFTGDTPSFQKTEVDEVREAQVVYEWVDSLSAPYSTELHALYEEMNALETLETRIYKALDKMEALTQHSQSDLSIWFPLEYELNLKYGVEQAESHDYLREFRQMISDDCTAKVKQEDPEKYRGLDWEQS